MPKRAMGSMLERKVRVERTDGVNKVEDANLEAGGQAEGSGWSDAAKKKGEIEDLAVVLAHRLIEVQEKWMGGQADRLIEVKEKWMGGQAERPELTFSWSLEEKWMGGQAERPQTDRLKRVKKMKRSESTERTDQRKRKTRTKGKLAPGRQERQERRSNERLYGGRTTRASTFAPKWLAGAPRSRSDLGLEWGRRISRRSTPAKGPQPKWESSVQRWPQRRRAKAGKGTTLKTKGSARTNLCGTTTTTTQRVFGGVGNDGGRGLKKKNPVQSCTQVVTPVGFGGGHQRGHQAGVVPGGILYVSQSLR
ncbi:hypothetical protein DEU56DRAFT_753392 [Suillus clintonianus]|uniref:uncharacterized protein n=1 Tax=Suillus clintonianus TaxID=1904413 RepID=UPI001B85CFC7|nr:uncharacterized protein DEU56DRAFT_753392 [Suillus clintonianus]KAG2147537.1 hypothetical protein DEU56DRAFT_753392 [Suillus clintonianus]